MSVHAARRRDRRPELECLEARRLLYATTGGQWAYGSRITYSFIPDGTSIGGTPSNLFSALEAEGFSDAVWQAQFMKAAAVWEAVAGINLARVSDSGDPIGTAGDQQDDPRFGDIRIGGFAQSLSTLAFTFATPPFNGGTLAGDMFFNTALPWQVNGTAWDLETVAIHELGHALGMAHSQIQSADMYAYYNNTKQSLTSDDIAGIQSIYGAPQPDSFEATYGNYTYSSAISIQGFLNPTLSQISLGNLEITANGQEWFYVTVPPSTTGTMTVAVQTGNLSSMSPAVAVNNTSMHLVGFAKAPNTYGWGGFASVSIPVSAGQGYFIQVMGADYGASGQGGYGLLVNFGSSAQAFIAPPNTVVAQQPDQSSSWSADTIASPAPTTSPSPGSSGWGNWSALTTAHSNPRSVHDDDMKEIIVGWVEGLGDTLEVSPPATVPPATSARGPAPMVRRPIASPANPVIVPLATPGSEIIRGIPDVTRAPFARARSRFLAIDTALAALGRGPAS